RLRCAEAMSHSSLRPATQAPAPSLPPAPDVVARMVAIVGTANVVSDAADLRTYECDALTSFRACPSLVVLPASTEEVVAVMKVAREARMPIVARGAGTGLSGGALPTPGSLVLALSRMTKILDVDFDNGLMRVQPGVINLDVSRHLGPAGYYYAP